MVRVRVRVRWLGLGLGLGLGLRLRLGLGLGALRLNQHSLKRRQTASPARLRPRVLLTPPEFR